MRLLDFAIDFAAVLSASRSVASKHVALRGRQLKGYNRSSGFGNAFKSKVTRASNASEAAAPSQEYGQAASSPESGVGAPVEAAKVNGGPSASASQSQTSSSSADDPRATQPKKNELVDRVTFGAALQKPDEVSTKVAEDLDLPKDVNVDIFYTTRGSKILDSVRKQERRNYEGRSHLGGPSKEHPMRYWPNPPPVQVEEQKESPAEVLEGAPSASDLDKEPLDTQLDTRPEQPLGPSKDTPDNDVSVVAELVDFKSKPAAAETPAVPRRSHDLRESTVPSTRMSRLWNYGGLAASMLGGAMTESVSRAFGSGGQGSVLLSGKNMERLVAKLSRMRGAALKLGQMMSFQDSKMLPAPIQEVMQRVQDRADYMPAWQRDRVLASNLGAEWRELFSEFEEKPMAAASIGQVHQARLKSNGKRVAVKIQFPGVSDSINSDLDNLGILLTATKLLPKGLYLNKTIDNARLELGWECDYLREAECAKRYRELLGDEQDTFMVPQVYSEASGKQVLTMDFMDGIGVTRVKSFTQEQRDWIGTQILRLCLREITEFKFMQTDPNWTNFLYNAETNRLELLDFGASREYPDHFITQYVGLLEAASRSDRETVKTLSESLGYLTGHESKTMLDAHIQSVLTLAEPFLATSPDVYDFKDQTITERVKALIPVMLQERLAPPPEETYSLHRKLSGAFLLCARLRSKVRCRDMFEDSLKTTGYAK